jgi:DNA-binding MarR family transcriptional regulator
MNSAPPNLRARKDTSHQQQALMTALLAAGFSEDAATALLSLDADMFHHVRRVMKGDVPQSLLDELATDLETTQFHALSALTRIRHGYGRSAPEEPTVGLLAEELAVDPSRASRIASDLVERGYLVRAVSQADGRRSVLELTEKAGHLFDAFHQAKWQRTMRLYEGWTTAEVVTFARLFAKYQRGMAEQYPPAG